MKKLFYFAVAAVALTACTNDELNVQDPVQPQVSGEAPVNFDVYLQRGITRGGGQAGDLTNDNIGTNGFGVFAYYTMGEKYDANAKPNFMYNQKVTCTGKATEGTLWSYEPVKYWPNEFGNAAISDEVDYVTFFAYAPWTKIEPTTGEVDVTEITDAAQKDKAQKYNIISVNKNTATGDPIIKYVVDTDPTTSVDLLWGVAAEKAADVYSPIDGQGQNKAVSVSAGKPFIDLVKPNNPQSDRLQFNLKHALAKVKVTIDYIADDFTPTGTSKTINADETRIFVRSFKIDGLAIKGALNLNNTVAGEPLWKDYDGVKDLNFDEVVFYDGRKDGKEGDVTGEQNNEAPQGLNPNIVENYALLANGKFTAEKNSGVTATPQLLFGGDETKNDGYFYVIPRNEENQKVNTTIVYDVETIDKNLAGMLSDGATHGLSTENVITKNDIFKGLDFKAGYQYLIKIHLGMTSVKIEATVTDWVDNGETHVDLPDNQEPITVTAANYVYPSTTPYTYKGKYFVSDYDVVYIPTAATLNDDAMNDIARYLGALYRAAAVSKIEYEGTTYTWNQEHGLKGSNWEDASGKTLVSTITANATALQTAGKLVLKADGQDITIFFKPTHSFQSFGDAAGTISWGGGSVVETATTITVGSNTYKKVVVFTNTADASFVGKVFYISNSATAGDTVYPLYNRSGEEVGIWVKVTAL